MSSLTANALQMLLASLDADPLAAAEKYEVLHLKLTKSVLWKGCPESEADALADEVLDRVAIKIAKGEQIENINAYASAALRFVWLEWLHANPPPPDGGEPPEIAVPPDIPILEDEDDRLPCLRVCLGEVVPDDTERELIIGYYDPDPGKKNKEHRKDMAERLGLTMTALKVRASRIRARPDR